MYIEESSFLSLSLINIFITFLILFLFQITEFFGFCGKIASLRLRTASPGPSQEALVEFENPLAAKVSFVFSLLFVCLMDGEMFVTFLICQTSLMLKDALIDGVPIQVVPAIEVFLFKKKMILKKEENSVTKEGEFSYKRRRMTQRKYFDFSLQRVPPQLESQEEVKSANLEVFHVFLTPFSAPPNPKPQNHIPIDLSLFFQGQLYQNDAEGTSRTSTSVVASMLAAGYTLGQDSFQKAVALDEQHSVRNYFFLSPSLLFFYYYYCLYVVLCC